MSNEYLDAEESIQTVLVHANAISRTFKDMDLGLTCMILCLLQDAAELQHSGIMSIARGRIDELHKQGLLKHNYVEDEG